MLTGEIDDNVASSIIAQMLFLQSDDPKKEISFYMNTPGGVVTAGLAIYDTMQSLSCPVATYCIGQCASMGAVLLCGGASGKRFAMKNSRVMIHQPSGGCQGTAADITIQAEEINKMKMMLYKIIALHCNKEAEEVMRDSERDFFLSSEEAKAYGVVDKII